MSRIINTANSADTNKFIFDNIKVFKPFIKSKDNLRFIPEFDDEAEHYRVTNYIDEHSDTNFYSDINTLDLCNLLDKFYDSNFSFIKLDDFQHLNLIEQMNYKLKIIQLLAELENIQKFCEAINIKLPNLLHQITIYINNIKC